MPPDTKVLFYIQEEDCFDNLSAFAIEWKGRLWPTVEHAYQASKVLDSEVDLIELIHSAKSPYEAKELTHKTENLSKIKPNWQAVKVNCMKELLYAKINQHAYVKKKLLETGEETIVEDSPVDSFWGRGSDWKGQNVIGKLWMELQDEIKLKV